jgi:BRCT domain type II-containing protein
MRKSGQTRILAIGEVGDRPREHCICLQGVLTIVFTGLLLIERKDMDVSDITLRNSF